jgi:kinesin family protein 2/24
VFEEDRENWSNLAIEGLDEVDSSSAQLAKAHDRLIGTILAEEEELIGTHRKHIDAMVMSVKEEMELLHDVDRPGSDVDAYVKALDKLLAAKVESICDIRHKLSVFTNHLLEEERLSRQFQARKE